MKRIWIINQILAYNFNIIKSVAILFQSGYSDLLFIPNINLVSLRLKGRDSKIIGGIPFNIFKNMLLTFKIALNMNLIESIPQSASFIAYVDDMKYNFRLSIHPSNFMENLSLRIIREENFSLDFFKYEEEIKIKPGLNFIGGRTCSGKTTLFYTLLSTFQGHVVSVEDPIESHINVVQTDANEMGYDEAVRSALRQNPDLIAIGEIRDFTSAQAAIRASLTGHKVLATIHINSINGLMDRLLELGCKFAKETVSQLFFIENFHIYVKSFDN